MNLGLVFSPFAYLSKAGDTALQVLEIVMTSLTHAGVQKLARGGGNVSSNIWGGRE